MEELTNFYKDHSDDMSFEDFQDFISYAVSSKIEMMPNKVSTLNKTVYYCPICIRKVPEELNHLFDEDGVYCPYCSKRLKWNSLSYYS